MSAPEPLSIEAPNYRPPRIVLILAGLGIGWFVIAQVVHGLWPITWLTGWLLLVLAFGLAAAGEAFFGGLFGWADRWDMSPGRISVTRKNLLFSRSEIYPLDEIAKLGVVETVDHDDEVRWVIEMQIRSGKRFRTRAFAPRINAERFLEKIEQTTGRSTNDD